MFIVRSKADIQKPKFLAKQTAWFPDNCLHNLRSSFLPPASLHSPHLHSGMSPFWGFISFWLPWYSSMLFHVPPSQSLRRSSSPTLSPSERALNGFCFQCCLLPLPPRPLPSQTQAQPSFPCGWLLGQSWLQNCSKTCTVPQCDHRPSPWDKPGSAPPS